MELFIQLWAELFKAYLKKNSKLEFLRFAWLMLSVAQNMYMDACDDV
jgi:hypothetical protein